MMTIQQNLKSNNLSLSLNEATDMVQNHPVWRLMSAFRATHSLLVVHAIKKEEVYMTISKANQQSLESTDNV